VLLLLLWTSIAYNSQRVLLALPTLHAQIGALTVHVLLWIEQLQQRGEVAQFTVRHGDFKVIDVPALVQSTVSTATLVLCRIIYS
jgi:hypothetical protein